MADQMPGFSGGPAAGLAAQNLQLELADQALEPLGL
jgi:hypothetical protein